MQVVRCQGGQIWVRMGSQSGCSVCDSGNGCGAGVFAKLLQRKPVIMVLKHQDINVEPGQMVTLAFPEKMYLKMVFTWYGWPLLAALVGAFAGFNMGVWLNFEALLLDVATLAASLLFGSIAMRALRLQRTENIFLNAMRVAVCSPSATPDMCDGPANPDISPRRTTSS